MATPLAVVICNPTVFKAKLWEFWGESMALRGCNPRGYGWKVWEWQLLVGEIYIILLYVGDIVGLNLETLR